MFNRGGYTTLNFVPSLATMIFGLMTGEAIRAAESKVNVVGGLLICAVSGLGERLGIELFRRLSAGETDLDAKLDAVQHGLVLADAGGVLRRDRRFGFRVWAFPLIVAGMNSILLYLMGQLLPGLDQGDAGAVLRLRRVHVLPGRPGEVRASHSLQPGAAVLLAVCVLAVSAEDFFPDLRGWPAEH